MRIRDLGIVVAFGLAVLPHPTWAWGDLGHEVTAVIAYDHMSASAKSKLDALLVSDTDTLTAQDFPARATWADKYREGHRQTATWHYVDIELDHPNLSSACFGLDDGPLDRVASQGPAQDCVVRKIEEFSRELSDPATSHSERLMALKFLIHLIGDVHQPLHASDNHDRGGNCVRISQSSYGEARNLHAFWDTTTVRALGNSAPEIARKLEARITPNDVRRWSASGPREWAEESFAMAKVDAYRLSNRPTCGEGGAVTLSAQYEATAVNDSALRLSEAGVRIASTLNRALR